MKSMKRIGALLLSLVMILSLVPVTAVALDATNFSLVSNSVDGTVGGTATVTFVADQDITVKYIDGILERYAVKDASNKIEIASISDPGGGNSNSAIDSNGDGNVVYSTPVGGLSIAAGDPIFTATYTVPAGTAPGDYQLTLSFEDPGDFSLGSDGSQHLYNVFHGVITVTAPSAAPAYELYYELDINTDADVDKYIDYAAGATVTATIYAKAASATNLQAFDLYVTNDALLEYSNYDSTYGTRIGTGGSGQASTDILQHIQFRFVEGSHIDIAIGTTPVALASIEFAISDIAVFSNDAINDGWMPITITADSNLATAENEKSINTTRTDEYELTISQPVLGAEVVTTYTVTYDPNTTDTVSGMPSPLTATKYHNRALTLSNAEPTRENYTFLGWSTTSGDSNTVDYAKGASFTENANRTLYAVWQRDLYTVRWYNNNAATPLLETDTNVPSGTAPSYDGAEPTKASTDSKTYTFIGWNTDQNATTGTFAANLPNVTADTDYYAIFSEADREYTVTWRAQDDDGTGTPLSTSTIVYNHAPEYQNGFTQPTKAEDANYTYEFAGWATTANQTSGTALASLPNVTADVTYYAAFNPVPKTFTVTLVPNGGTIETGYEVTEYTYGTGATLPGDPNITKTGYTFAGWYTDENFADGTGPVASITTTDSGNKTFYAKWVENTYSVQYDPGTGTGTVYTDSGIKYETDSYTIKAWNDPAVNFTAPTGYVFAGWEASNGQTYNTGSSYNKMSAVNGDTIILTAQWSQDAYNITYVFTDGSETLTSVTNGNPDTYSKASGLTLTAPSKTGYTFQSWSAVYTTGGATLALTSGNTIPAGTEGNLTITGTFSKDNYTITYNANGGTVDPASQNYTITSTDALAIPTRNGYDFAGWKNEGAAVGSWDANETTNPAGQNLSSDWGNVTLTAQWTQKTYNITFTGMTTADNTGTYKIEDTDTIASKQSNPTKDYYTFTGWTPDGAGNWGTTPIAGTTTVTGKYGDVTLTAGWTAIDYTVTYYTYPEGTDPNTTLDTQTFNADDPSITVPTVPARDGYTGEWSQDYSGTNPPLGTSVDVYPVYTAINYTITYDGNGGTPSVATQDYNIESTAALATATRPGYTFAGWKNEGAAVGSWAANETTVPAGQNLNSDWGTVTLTAQWTATTYHITFVTEGTAIPVMDYTIEDTTALPYSSGNGLYTFKQWRLTAATGAHNWGDVKDEGNNIAGATFNSTATPNTVEGHYGDITLTAEWDISFTYSVDEYKYAFTGWKMLRIDATDLAAGTIYTFDGQPMYYTTDEFYLIDKTNDTGVFYTLIAPAYVVTSPSLALNKAGEGKVGTSTAAAAVLYGDGELTGDINGDGKLNIADANIIHQMVERGGGYYTTSQLSILARLRCDIDTDTSGANCEYRGSINDTNAIVNLINKVQ